MGQLCDRGWAWLTVAVEGLGTSRSDFALKALLWGQLPSLAFRLHLSCSRCQKMKAGRHDWCEVSLLSLGLSP